MLFFESKVCKHCFVLTEKNCLLNILVCASKYSGGSVMYYPDFHASRNPAAAEKFENEFV